MYRCSNNSRMKNKLYIALLGFIVLSLIYLYTIRVTTSHVDIKDCLISYTSEYKLAYNSNGLMLSPQTLGTQFIFINFFDNQNINRKEFIDEKIKNGYTLSKTIIKKLVIYTGFSHSDNNFTKDTVNYYLVGKSFYIHYIIYDKHIEDLVESCHKTWNQESKKSIDISEYLIKNIQKELNLTHEEAILYLKKLSHQ